MREPIRPPSSFGGNEANADLRYVEVYSISTDPEEPPLVFQPVKVKRLRFTGYVPSSSGVVDGGNTDFTIRTTKSHLKHGERGNGIAVTFDIDGGITDNAEASWDEGLAELTITAKSSTTTWLEVSTAVAGVLSGAFVLVPVDGTEEVGGSFGTLVAGLDGGADGDWEAYDQEFAVGDHDLASTVETGDRFWVTWRNDSQRWEIVASNAQLHQQLAMITDIEDTGTSPHYSTTYDLTFQVPATVAHQTIVRAVLLDMGSTSMALQVANPDTLTLEELKFGAVDIRIEGTPKVGEVVLVWTSDGEHAVPGYEWFDEEFTVISGSPRAVFCHPLNSTDELRGLPTWDQPTKQFLGHDADTKELAWFEDTGGSGDIPEWVFEYPTDPVPGVTYTAGYALDLNTNAFEFDPTEITSFGATWQFFRHLAGDTNPSGANSPHWKTVSNFASANQMIWHQSDSWAFKTTTDYAGSSTSPQFLLNWGAANGGDWQWKSAASYNTTDKLLLRSNAGTWGWVADKRPSSIALDTTGNSLRVTLNLEDGTSINGTIAVTAILNALQAYAAGDDQSIGHDASGATEWQEDGTCS